MRGSIETKGNFLLNQNWQFGWNATWLSDKFFANDYKLQGIDFSNYYFQDVVSSIYLRGQADHSFFDLSAYHFEGTTANDDNRTLPLAAPVFDYNRVFAMPEDRTNGIGGEATVDVNVANIDQTNAAFQSTGLQTFDNAYHLYNVCETTVGNKYVNTYYPGSVHAAQHRRRLCPRIGAGLLAAQLYRHDRRSLEAVRLRTPRRRIDRVSTKRARSPTRVRSGRARSRTRARRRSSPGAIKVRSPAAWRASASNIVIRSR